MKLWTHTVFTIKASIPICCVRPYACTVRHINVNNLIIAIFCIRLEEDGTKTCLSDYYLNGDVCTGMPINFFLSKSIILITLFQYIIV